ncbi:hypothetical protein PAXINDRAFT_102240 [Paxillus involutus ATCC 200175]|uniref:Uncharacterized protein n=1 Tax=Paxillus involutus ATCC 200175 TaxID=664439 RepID=A0A0C9TQR2_PAXIN|nr:hypothetical protein PAXINDRAFT_102240 [Paxillus involutus ATCC 200175]
MVAQGWSTTPLATPRNLTVPVQSSLQPTPLTNPLSPTIASRKPLWSTHRCFVGHIVHIVERHAYHICTALNVDVPSVLLSKQLPNPSAVQGVILSPPSILRHPYLSLMVPSFPQPRSHIHAHSSELSLLTVALALPSPSVLSGPHSSHPCSTSNAQSLELTASVDDTPAEAPLTSATVSSPPIPQTTTKMLNTRRIGVPTRVWNPFGGCLAAITTETSGASGGHGQAAPTRWGVPADSNRSARTPGTVLGDAASPSQATPVHWSSVDIVDIGVKDKTLQLNRQSQRSLKFSASLK